MVTDDVRNINSLISNFIAFLNTPVKHGDFHSNIVHLNIVQYAKSQ